ncbi:MAG: hypothetical protein ACT4OG_03830 [Alphaproteobacteria bacterium]
MRISILAAAAAAFLVSPALASEAGKESPQTAPAAEMPSAGLMVIHHRVADYAKWRPVYDAHKAMRDTAGLDYCEVRQPVGDATDVFVACNMTDVDKAKAFAASKDLKEAMKDAGVMGTPEIHYLSPPK